MCIVVSRSGAAKVQDVFDAVFVGHLEGFIVSVYQICTVVFEVRCSMRVCLVGVSSGWGG